MSVQKTTIFVHRQLSPTIVEFSASLSSNWLSGGSRHVVINENAVDMAEDGEQTRGSSGGLAAHDHGEMQPLLGDIPSAFRAPASRGFSWMRDYAPQVLRGGTFSNCMLWLLLARWYGLYVVAFAGVFSYGLLWHSTIAIALGFAGLAIVAVTVSRTVYQGAACCFHPIISISSPSFHVLYPRCAGSTRTLSFAFSVSLIQNL